MEGEEEKRINELVSVREVGMGRARGGREKEKERREEEKRIMVRNGVEELVSVREVGMWRERGGRKRGKEGKRVMVRIGNVTTVKPSQQ